MIGVSQAAIANFEKNGEGVQLKTLLKILNALELDLMVENRRETQPEDYI